MRVRVIYLDDDGYEAYRYDYSWNEAKAVFGNVIDEMVKAGVKVRQVGDKIIEILG